MKNASQIGAHLVSVAAIQAAAGSAGTWLQLLPAGTFKGRDGRGPWTTGDHARMRKIVARTLEIAGATELAIDYDHQTVFGAKDGVGGTAKAAGWIKELRVRGDGIWGRVEWTDAATAAIKAGEYRYLSPVFFHDKKGQVIALQMASLTNTPNLDLAQVAASIRLSETSDEGDPMDKIAAALGLAAGSGEDAVLSALNAVLASSSAIAKAAGLKDDAKPEEIQTAVASAIADRTKFAEAAGLKADAATDDIVTTVASAIKSTAPDPAKFVPIAQVTALQKDVKALQEKISGGEAETAVASAIKDGKLAPALKEWGLSLAKSDLKAFQAFTDGAPTLTAAQTATAKKPDAIDAEDPVALSAAATAYQKKMADAGQTIDIARAVAAVKEGKS